MTELFNIVLFGSALWGIGLLVIFIIICFYSDFRENGFIAFISLLIVCLTFYFYGRDSLKYIISLISWKIIILYFMLGFIYSIIRIFFYGRSEMKKVNEDRLKGVSYEHKIDKDIKEHVFRWWFLWVISLINWLISDLIKDLYYFVYRKLNKLFNFYLELGIKSVKEVPKNNKL